MAETLWGDLLFTKSKINKASCVIPGEAQYNTDDLSDNDQILTFGRAHGKSGPRQSNGLSATSAMVELTTMKQTLPGNAKVELMNENITAQPSYSLPGIIKDHW